MLTRRRFLALGVTAVAAVVSSCSSGSSNAKRAANKTVQDFSGRFAKFEPAVEPNGDLSKVVWPDFVTDAGPGVKRLYEFQVTHGDLMRYMPCFCGCGENAGHRNNRDCYVRQVNADGSVVFDSMAPT